MMLLLQNGWCTPPVWARVHGGPRSTCVRACVRAVLFVNPTTAGVLARPDDLVSVLQPRDRLLVDET